VVSIIIPCYNSAITIQRALESVINQTYTDFEIIIVDDGSTDNTKDVIAAFFKDLSLKYTYIYQQNSGPSVARNRGIKNASGEYIAFLDSDDDWHPQKIMLQIALMKELNIKISGTNHKIISQKDLEIEKAIDYQNRQSMPYAKIFWPRILFKSPFATPSVVIHKSLKHYLFDENMKYSEDYNLWKRITYQYKAIKILLPLTYTFKHDYLSDNNSLSTNLKLMQQGVENSFVSLLKNIDIAIYDKFLIIVALLFSKFKYLRRILQSYMK